MTTSAATDPLRFDDAESRRVEAVYTTPDVVEQRRTVLGLLDLRPGERVLDVGVGPGFLASEMAAAVGPTGLVCGVDPSGSMLALARARIADGPAAPVDLRTGTATGIPYSDERFDAVVSTQVLEYVGDIPAALTEIRRVLRPGGRLLILDTDWDSIVWHSGDDARMERVLAAWEAHLVDPHLPRTLAARLRTAGFAVAQPSVIPLLNAGYAAATYSGGLIPIVAAFVTDRDGLAADDLAAWRSDLEALGEEYFFSLNRYVFTANKSA
jgi:ubiquinone/menaquinone biosynthesis C-methylase UbiE